MNKQPEDQTPRIVGVILIAVTLLWILTHRAL
jgi:hypothetical protein